MTAKARRPTQPPAPATAPRYYTPEELVDPAGDFRFPTTARQLRDWAYERRIPHNRMGGRISFTAADAHAVARVFAVPAVADARATG